jgi:hypothetical protein
MLKKCAPGYDLRLATHSRVVTFGNKVFRELPKSDTIEYGHIRKMVRFLELSRDCAAKWLPAVIKPEQPEQIVRLAASEAAKETSSPATTKPAKKIST